MEHFINIPIILYRWTELFLIRHEGPRAGQERDPTRIAEGIARAVGAPLVPHLQTLKQDNSTPLAVRVTLDTENVSSYQRRGFLKKTSPTLIL